MQHVTKILSAARMARAAAALGLCAAACTTLLAADFWTAKPFTEWSDKEVERMLTDSPWSKKVSVSLLDVSLSSRVGGLSGGIIGRGVGSRGGFGGAGGGVGGDGAGNLGGGSFMGSPLRARLTVRWSSALPIQQALARRLGSESALASADLSTAFDVEESFYRVTVLGVSPEVTQIAGSLADLQAATILRRKASAPIGAADIEIVVEEDTPTIEFRFHRTDAISPSDQEVEFVTAFGGVSVKATFRLKDMMFGDRLGL
jgi:hypothetical protein